MRNEQNRGLAEISCNKDKCGKGELAAAEHLLSTYSAPSQDIKLLYNYGFRSLSLTEIRY
jgi:hypothetical protein